MYTKNGYEVKLFIDGFEITNQVGTKLINFSIFESIEDPIPACKLEFLAHKEFLEQRPILDGSEILVYVKSESFKMEEAYCFRVFSIDKIIQSQEFLTIYVTGLIDFLDGYTPANTFNTFAPSCEILRTIAEKYKLKYDIDTTSDSQLWVAGENNIYQFIAKLAKKAYADDTSAFFWCIDRRKRLLFKNITSLFAGRSKEIYSFVQSTGYSLQNKMYYYTAVVPSMENGLNNIKAGGYGGNNYYFDFNTYSNKSAFCKKAFSGNKYLNISKVYSKGLAPKFLPLDVGNFHPNYYNAEKQNERILATYSTQLTVVSQILQNYRLGQIVNFYPGDTNSAAYIIPALSGLYIIKTITLNITAQAATGTLQLSSQGLNSENSVVEVY